MATRYQRRFCFKVNVLVTVHRKDAEHAEGYLQGRREPGWARVQFAIRLCRVMASDLAEGAKQSPGQEGDCFAGDGAASRPCAVMLEQAQSAHAAVPGGVHDLTL